MTALVCVHSPAVLACLCVLSPSVTDIQPTSFHIISWFKSSCDAAPVQRALVLCPVCSRSLSALSVRHWRLGSNLPARGGVSCVGAVAQSICLHQWAGVAVGLGQQDPAKHQLLAAFYTDSHQVGHIYSAASSTLRLEDFSALIAWIILFALAVWTLRSLHSLSLMRPFINPHGRLFIAHISGYRG